MEVEQKEERKSNVILAIDIGIKNLSYCMIRYQEEGHSWQDRHIQIVRWELIDILKENASRRKSAKNLDRCTLCKYLHQILLCRDWTDVDKVVVESQPSKSNAIVAQAVLMWFYCVAHKSVFSQHAKQKLTLKIPGRCEDKYERDLQINLTSKYPTYYSRKKAAVAYTDKILEIPLLVEIDDESRSRYNNASKKDDFADSLLHALVAVFRH